MLMPRREANISCGICQWEWALLAEKQIHAGGTLTDMEYPYSWHTGALPDLALLRSHAFGFELIREIALDRGLTYLTADVLAPWLHTYL
jgi:hypothetical protein